MEKPRAIDDMEDSGTGTAKASSGEHARSSVQEGHVIEHDRFPHLANMSPEDLAALERRVRWKIDYRLLPCLLILYMLNYLDRYGSSSSASRYSKLRL